jgi:hypothetical protein
MLTFIPAGDFPTTVYSLLNSTPLINSTQLGQSSDIASEWTQQKTHYSSVVVGGMVSRVPLQWHCLPGAGWCGNTVSCSSSFYCMMSPWTWRVPLLCVYGPLHSNGSACYNIFKLFMDLIHTWIATYISVSYPVLSGYKIPCCVLGTVVIWKPHYFE